MDAEIRGNVNDPEAVTLHEGAEGFGDGKGYVLHHVILLSLFQRRKIFFFFGGGDMRTLRCMAVVVVGVLVGCALGALLAGVCLLVGG